MACLRTTPGVAISAMTTVCVYMYMYKHSTLTYMYMSYARLSCKALFTVEDLRKSFLLTFCLLYAEHIWIFSFHICQSGAIFLKNIVWPEY